MFDFAWTEIALIGVVALVAIGPKDLPVAIKAVAAMVKKARRMAGEFQTHVDEMVKDANLNEVRDQISQLRNLDIKGTIERAVDSDGSIRRTMNENPLDTPASVPAADAAPMGEVPGASFATRDVSSLGRADAGHPPGADKSLASAEEMHDGVPAFIPPAIARPLVPPAFIPPSTARFASTHAT